MSSQPTANDTAPEAVSSLPSGEPIDASPKTPSFPPNSSSPSSSSSSTSKKNPSSSSPPVKAVLASAPAQADAFLAHLHRCATSRAGTDTVLLFLTYATRLGGSVLETASRTALQSSARKLVAAAYKLPPSTTVVLSSSASSAPSPVAAMALVLAARLKALSGMLSEWRTMARLWGLLGMYFSAKKLVAAATSAAPAGEDPEKTTKSKRSDAERRFDMSLAAAQLIAIMAFQAAENLALLGSKKILPFAPRTQGKLARFSVRAWMVYIGMELGRLLVERGRREKSAGPKGAVADKAWAEEWYKGFTRTLAWAPLTVHWGMDQGPLPDLAVSLLAAYPATGQMRDLWKSTA